MSKGINEGAISGTGKAQRISMGGRFCLAAILVFMVQSVLGQSQQWKLVWSDEFETPGMPDPKKWGYYVGHPQGQSQYYTKARKENARVEGGKLVIEGRREKFETTGYTSARLHTKGLASWKKGRIEVKAKVPTGLGMFPAIWTLGDNIGTVGWPACGELDIMEYVGWDPNKIHANVHTKTYCHIYRSSKGKNITTPAPYEKYHVFAMDWFEDRLDFYLDDTKYHTFKNEGKGPDTWPMDTTHYLIINLAIGGWGGARGMDTTIYPKQFLVEYVRIYQEPGPVTSLFAGMQKDLGPKKGSLISFPSQLSINLPHRQDVKLTVYDLNQRLVAERFLPSLSGGRHVYGSEGLGIPKGTYVLQLKTAGGDLLDSQGLQPK